MSNLSNFSNNSSPISAFSCIVNVSHSSLTDYAWDVAVFDPKFDIAGPVISATLILFFLLGVPWNLLVIAAIIKKKLYTQPIIVLLFNFSLTNLLVALLVMPFSIVSGIVGEYAFGDTDRMRCYICQTGLLTILLPWVSFHTLALMAVDRFIYLKKPLNYSWIVTPKRTVIALIVVWALCIVLVIPPFFEFGLIQFSFTVATCLPRLSGRTSIAPNHNYWILITIEALVPIMTIFILYMWIFCLIRKTLTKTLKRSTSLVTKPVVVSSHSRKHTQSQIRLVWLFGAIFTANIIIGVPLVVLVLSVVILGPFGVPTLAYTAAYLLVLLQTVIHPILEVCLIKEFSQMIFALWRAVCCRDTKQSSSTPTRLTERQLTITSQIGRDNSIRTLKCSTSSTTSATRVAEKNSTGQEHSENNSTSTLVTTL